MMPTAIPRHTDFLSTYNFYSNSIDFRIHSSKLIEKFKNVQSFQLNQISNGKFHFDKKRKEILLLKYDMWSRWIYEIENLLIELGSDHDERIITQKHIDLILSLADKTTEKYEYVMLEQHCNYFDIPFAKLWLEAHKSVYHLLEIKILSLKGYSFEIAFEILINTIIESLQYTLLELHELNGICMYFDNKQYNTKVESNEIPFFVFTNLDKVNRKLTGKHLIIERFNVYKKYFKFEEIFLKNYSENPFTDEVFDAIEQADVKINYRLNY